jgi:hypothetical protein
LIEFFRDTKGIFQLEVISSSSSEKEKKEEKNLCKLDDRGIHYGTLNTEVIKPRAIRWEAYVTLMNRKRILST